jgi:hypothetical protein
MKTKILKPYFILLICLVAIPGIVCAQGKKAKTAKQSGPKTENIQLFNGKNLTNWAFHLKDPSVDPAKVFTVQNGVIHITGNPFGYMRTKDIYADYKLHVEWRWPVEGTNSGVFVNTQLPDTIWPKTIECQLQAGNAGDFICNGIEMNEHKDKSKKSITKMAASSEKAVGEWNTMEVTCKKNTIEVYINGVLQNKGTNVSESKGYICLQSEGKDIEFRNVYLNKLK